MSDREMLATAKRRLGIDRLALQVHDASFPSNPAEDWGRGSPYSLGAERLFDFAANLGFDTIQLGPQGLTQRGNPSPYDGTLFSRNPLNLPLGRFVRQGRLSATTLGNMLVSQSMEPISNAELCDRFESALSEIVAGADPVDRAAARQYLADNESWLVPDALYGALCSEHSAPWWREWHRTLQGTFDQRLFCPRTGEEKQAARRLSELRSKYSQLVEDYALTQWLLDVEHQALRARLKPLGLSLFADLQVGLSPQDSWARCGLFLDEYRMGAPPSRTNPEGQPWGYAVFDPRLLGTLGQPGPALEFVRARLHKSFSECDGVRIDHPHGWVDPWVYRADDPDPIHAVQEGARLFSSPNEPDHPDLSPQAIARAEQIDRSQPRHADRRVMSLDEAQVVRYSLLIDAIIEQARAQSESVATIACEVLSTLPYPIQRVMQRHGLGRFRVVQKAKLDDTTDVYRIEAARPEDWIMPGTHDTPSIWELAEKWCLGPEGRRWAEYLSSLAAPPQDQTNHVDQIAASPGELVNALITAMLTSQARHLSIFFPDLFGMTERYNQPGVIAESNWRLRVPGDFEQQYASRCRRGLAIDVVGCFRQAVQLRLQLGVQMHASDR